MPARPLPRARGWTAAVGHAGCDRAVFDAGARMDRSGCARTRRRTRLHCVRTDGPDANALGVAGDCVFTVRTRADGPPWVRAHGPRLKFSPRTRGWTVPLSRERTQPSLAPACARMDRRFSICSSSRCIGADGLPAPERKGLTTGVSSAPARMDRGTCVTRWWPNQARWSAWPKLLGCLDRWSSATVNVLGAS